jgi:phage tail-like protein
MVMADTNDVYRATTNAAFRFVVDVGGETQAAFTECSLPSIEWEVEEVKEGGLNTYTHQLPGRRKAGKVSLKNGVGKSSLLDWYIQAMSEQFKRKPVTIKLLDVAYKTVITWNLEDAYPVKWSGPQLKTDANAVAIQTLDFACGEITVKTS